MKTKLWMLIFCTLILCSCSKPEEIEHQNEPQPLKIEEQKDFLYSEDVYTIPFLEEQLAFVDEKENLIVSYVININSEDARQLTDELQSKAMNQIMNIKKSDEGYIQNSVSLTGTAMESDRYVTIFIKQDPFVWESEKGTSQNDIYMFDKTSRALISQEQMLKDLNMSEEDVLAKVKEQFQESGIAICTTGPGDCYYEPRIYKDDPYIPDTIMYINEQNQLVVYMQKSLGRAYEWVPVMLDLS